jgi:probable F420-dependent oxidoreductase
MDFGLAIFPSDETLDPATLARMVQDRGFESLLFPEHTHIPVSRLTPYPAGGELPREYWRTLDPFVALTAAASATDRLRIGTGVCLVAQRDPIVTAKAVASLDLLSGGRFLFGVGAGWNIEELRHHGVDPDSRWARMREHVEAMKALWTQDEASYEGSFVRLEPSWSWPKPVQKPHPPVLVGGNGRNVLKRVVAFGDAWYPNRFGDDDRLRGRIEALQEMAREAGRGRIPVTLAVAPTDARELELYERAGVTRAVWYLPSADRDRIERALDRYVAAVADYSNAPV